MGFNSDSISTDRILNLFWRWDTSPQHIQQSAIPFLHTPLSPVPCPALTPHPPKYANCVTTGGASLYKTVDESEDIRHVQNMPNVMATLPNIGGALCSMPQSLAHALLDCRAVTLPRRKSC